MKKLIFAICFLALLVPGFYGYTQSQSQETKVRTKTGDVERMKAMVRKYEPKPGQKFDLTADGKEVVDTNGCGANACKCEGVKPCMDLIDSGKCKGDSFHCVGPPPVCICEK